MEVLIGRVKQSSMDDVLKSVSGMDSTLLSVIPNPYIKSIVETEEYVGNNPIEWMANGANHRMLDRVAVRDIAINWVCCDVDLTALARILAEGDALLPANIWLCFLKILIQGETYFTIGHIDTDEDNSPYFFLGLDE